jgi:O-antigen/teichoic acid export membrane protein
MDKKKLFRDLSANTIQTGITQLAGLIIFYVLSRYIPKEEFGEYSWTTAVGSTIIAIGSFGLDSVLVKRIATGENPKIISGIHFFHTILIAVLLLISLFVVQLFFPTLFLYHPLFILIIVQLTVSNIANSFKNSLTGMEAFKPLAAVSLWLNLTKILILFGLLITRALTIRSTVLGFLVASILELVISYYFVSTKINHRLIPLFHRRTYKEFVVESLPQLGVVLFDSALARIDWVLLGIIGTVSATAEYGFAYKFFELSKLPLLILSPVLLTRLSRLYTSDDLISKEKQQSIQGLFDLELFISFLIPIIMVSVWADLIDLITVCKYGAVNTVNYTILAICVPLHFSINLLWTMSFVQGQLKSIMYITISVSILNIVSNIILIPYLGNLGSALSFAVSTAVQFFLYLSQVKKEKVQVRFIKLPIFLISACIAVIAGKLLFSNIYYAAIFACTTYCGFCFFTKQISLKFLK